MFGKTIYVIYYENYAHNVEGWQIESFNNAEEAKKWIDEQGNKIKVIDIAQSIY